MQFSTSIENMIGAVVEIARMPLSVENVNGIGAVRNVLHVRAMTERGGNIDEDVARNPCLSQIVGIGVGRLKAVVEAPIEIVDSSLAVVFLTEVMKVRVGDA